MSSEVIPAHEVVAALAHAIERDQLAVHYQPIIDLATGQIIDLEALARWEHPDWGCIPPASFIPLAEQSGLILPLGRWVLRTACQQLASWQPLFARTALPNVSVNVSVLQLGSSHFLDEVMTALLEARLRPDRLTLEITESALLQESKQSISLLETLRRRGLSISIDDFGVGYSSLSYLRWMTVTNLKIDRSFVASLGVHANAEIIVNGIITIAKDLGISVTGEGIDQRRQLLKLQAMGCHRGQGYYFSQPLPSEAMGHLLQRQALGHGLPRKAADPDRGKRRPSQPDDRTVLVVDDDEHIRTLTSLVLEHGGYTVATAANGARALEMVKQRPPTVIVLDMMMPVMNGWDFSRSYHDLPGPHAPIVMLTANPEALRQQAEVGAVGGLAKPFEIDDMLATVAKIVPARLA